VEKILSQGHFDGLCLIYSVFNSYRSLISPEQTALDFVEQRNTLWRKVISITPSLHNFVRSDVGSDFGLDEDQTKISALTGAQ